MQALYNILSVTGSFDNNAPEGVCAWAQGGYM